MAGKCAKCGHPEQAHQHMGRKLCSEIVAKESDPFDYEICGCTGYERERRRDEMFRAFALRSGSPRMTDMASKRVELFREYINLVDSRVDLFRQTSIERERRRGK